MHTEYTGSTTLRFTIRFIGIPGTTIHFTTIRGVGRFPTTTDGVIHIMDGDTLTTDGEIPITAGDTHTMAGDTRVMAGDIILLIGVEVIIMDIQAIIHQLMPVATDISMDKEDREAPVLQEMI